MHTIQNNLLKSHSTQKDRSPLKLDKKKLKKAATVTLQEVESIKLKYSELFERANHATFDIFEFTDNIGRTNSLPHLMTYMLKNLPDIDPYVGCYDFNKVVAFFSKIQQGYRESIAYHNDLHAADVSQMIYYFLKTTNLNNIAELNHLDMVSMLTAAACHDFDHDGFTNTYHVSMMTERSVRYHDECVQENYHTAEAMAILVKP